LGLVLALQKEWSTTPFLAIFLKRYKMIKYRLSKGVHISIAAETAYTDVPADLLNDRYILTDEMGDRKFLINYTVKYFIDKFSIPKTQNEVIEEIAKDINSNIEVIKKNCSSFFKFLCKRKIIVPEDWTEHNVSKQTLFKEGDKIDDLHITEIIANKQTMDIYLANDKTTNTNYVIKLLNPQKTINSKEYEEELNDLQHEYEMLQRIKDIPSICQAHAFNKKDDRSAYIILEHINGKPLPRFLRQSQNLNDADCFSIISKTLKAFSLLHKKRLIHGDIHPSNIMVGEGKSTKIIDFGLSVDLNVENDEVPRMGGVLYYMPPERIRISSNNKFTKEPNFQSDVYQLGLIIYYTLYRTEPFTGFIWEQLAKSIKEGEIVYPPLSYLNTIVSEEVISIMKKCLNIKPHKRYSNAKEILEDFIKVTTEEKVFSEN
jgi:tRNA A-37 threonylcarbamoyl transferase component Bud32